MVKSKLKYISKYISTPALGFVAFVEDNATMSSIQYLENKSYVEFCAKPKKVNPITFNFSMKNKCLDSTQTYIELTKGY